MTRKPRVGWIIDSSPYPALQLPWLALSPVGKIRYGGVARYLNQRASLEMELFRPWRHYDALVFVKMMNPACQRLARERRQKGTKIIFDANINYYEDWGDYIIPGTRPREEQRTWAVAMTSAADAVVADSDYLAEVCRRYNSEVTCVPDAVDTDLYAPGPLKPVSPDKRLHLIWCGIGKKAQPLELLEPVLSRLRNDLRFTIVTNPDEPHNPWPDVLRRLKEKRLADIAMFKYRRYPHLLREADLIVSPRFLENAYEAAHTEYKITLGMAVGLLVLASPQRAYVQALEGSGAGWICRTEEEWEDRLRFCIAHRPVLKKMGAAARQRVLDRYSIPVVARTYEEVLWTALNHDRQAVG